MRMYKRNKVKARKSFLFTESSLRVWNKEHLFDFVVTLYFISIGYNALRSSKVCQDYLSDANWVLVSYYQVINDAEINAIKKCIILLHNNISP